MSRIAELGNQDYTNAFIAVIAIMTLLKMIDILNELIDSISRDLEGQLFKANINDSLW